MNHTLVFHTIDIARKIQKLIDFRAAPISLSYSEASALLIIDSEGDLSQKTLSLMLNLEPASVVTLIDELEKSNLVNRLDANADRRKYQIVLTKKGKNKVEQIKDRSSELNNFLKTKLGAAEIHSFLKTITKLSLDLNQWKEVKSENISSK